MNRLKGLAAYLAGIAAVTVLCVAIVYGSGINDQNGPGTGNQNGGNGGGATNSTNINKNDSLRTSAVKCFGAAQIVWTLRAATGIDSLTVVQVSQDSTHWFNTVSTQPYDVLGYAQVMGVSGWTSTAAAVGDSLKNGPYTVMLYPIDGGGPTVGTVGSAPLRMIFNRYARLKIRTKATIPITTPVITCRVLYNPGSTEADYSNAYTDSP